MAEVAHSDKHAAVLFTTVKGLQLNTKRLDYNWKDSDINAGC
jgi:hypothetical protein